MYNLTAEEEIAGLTHNFKEYWNKHWNRMVDNTGKVRHLKRITDNI